MNNFTIKIQSWIITEFKIWNIILKLIKNL